MSKNSREVQALLASLSEEDQKSLNEIAQQPLYKVYLSLNPKQVDELHRIYMRVICKNRHTILANMESQARFEADKAAAVAASEAQHDHAHDTPIDVVASDAESGTPVSEPLPPAPADISTPVVG